MIRLLGFVKMAKKQLRYVPPDNASTKTFSVELFSLRQRAAERSCTVGSHHASSEEAKHDGIHVHPYSTEVAEGKDRRGAAVEEEDISAAAPRRVPSEEEAERIAAVQRATPLPDAVGKEANPRHSNDCERRDLDDESATQPNRHCQSLHSDLQQRLEKLVVPTTPIDYRTQKGRIQEEEEDSFHAVPCHTEDNLEDHYVLLRTCKRADESVGHSNSLQSA